MQNILSVKNLSIAYNNKTVVQNVNFELNHGEILAIVGESGSGKSTILKAVNGLLESAGKISAGQILFNGREITNIATEERRKLSGEAIAMIFQHAAAHHFVRSARLANKFTKVCNHIKIGLTRNLLRERQI